MLRRFLMGDWSRGLTVFQFAFSQILIVTIVMINQLNYMLEKDLGFHPGEVVLVSAPTFNADKLKAFKNELLQHPEISGVTLCDGPPLRLSSSGMDLTLRRAGEMLGDWQELRECFALASFLFHGGHTRMFQVYVFNPICPMRFQKSSDRRIQII